MTNRTPLLVTIDVEGVVETGSCHSVDILDEVLADLSLPATMFVTPKVIRERTETVEQWIDDDHTVGLHIHPGRLGGDSDWLGEYGQDAIESFLEEGIAVFESNLGERPQTFRAGRWSFSDDLLRALAATGFEFDASHRPVDPCAPYTSHDVVELPLSVFGSSIFRSQFLPWNVETLPLSIDALLASSFRSIACYIATWRILATEQPYLMVGLHDYDLTSRSRRGRVERYLARVSEFTTPVTIDEFETRMAEQNH
ncbi:polysaccharide deacetylase family protein [Natrinema zhouii]|uniref:Polysaccharide deacetylase family protein n=1 Tax=Natrinema zhouii TaxID=1710539 RepID=A0A7D6CPU1_9EURY|nr:polysaccharide deacetylase family protein [Natrinema zhouii]QLK26818.1 polysaccharide deacetylase family protein [Natrinema zhouii]